MVEVGLRYDILALICIAIHKFERECMMFWDSDEFEQVADLACSVSPFMMQTVCDTIKRHPKLLDKPRVAELLKTHLELAKVVAPGDSGLGLDQSN